MEGDDEEKRSAYEKKESLTGRQSTHQRQSTTRANQKRMAAAADELAEENRITQVTNLHYRKFYEDELENDRQLFPDPDEPFIRIPIKRGQSRGL